MRKLSTNIPVKSSAIGENFIINLYYSDCGVDCLFTGLPVSGLYMDIFQDGCEEPIATELMSSMSAEAASKSFSRASNIVASYRHDFIATVFKQRLSSNCPGLADTFADRIDGEHDIVSRIAVVPVSGVLNI